MYYGLLVWGIECHRLEEVLKKTLRLITNSKYIAHTNPLFCQLNLLKIKDIFKLRLLKFYYKLTCDLLSSYFNTYLDVINRAPPRQLRINLIHQPVIKRNNAKCGLLYQKSEVRSQKFYLNIYTYTKLSNIFLYITFNRLNVMKIYMYSLYVYISRRLQ